MTAAPKYDMEIMLRSTIDAAELPESSGSRKPASPPTEMQTKKCQRSSDNARQHRQQPYVEDIGDAVLTDDRRRPVVGDRAAKRHRRPSRREDIDARILQRPGTPVGAASELRVAVGSEGV
jgi:hypothetical protein